MATDIKGKVKKITFNVDNQLFENFNYKVREEGFSMQRALQLLVSHYVNDNLTMKPGIVNESEKRTTT